MKTSTLQSLIKRNAEDITMWEEVRSEITETIRITGVTKRILKDSSDGSEAAVKEISANYKGLLTQLHKDKDRCALAINKLVAIQKELKAELRSQHASARANAAVEAMFRAEEYDNIQ